MKQPEEINITRQEGEALIERLETGTWTTQDRQVLAQIVRLYFWLVFMLQESKLSLKRFRAMLFGQPAKPRKSTLGTRETERNKSVHESVEGNQSPTAKGQEVA